MISVLRATPFAAALLLAIACGGQSPVDESLQADLNAAAAGSVELAPRGAGTAIVSAIESKNPSQPRVAPVRQTKAPERTPRPETRQVTQTADSPEPTATRPASIPRVSPPPPGGYKTVNEVIRNAPFPIKP